MTVDEVPQKRVVPAGLHQIEVPVHAAHLPQEMQIDEHETEIHERRGVRPDDERVNGKDQAARRIDDAQFVNGGHQHGCQDQQRAGVADGFDEHMRIQSKPSLLPVLCPVFQIR